MEVESPTTLKVADMPAKDVEDDSGSWPLQEFTLFPKLPIEIRLHICHDTLPRGRLVEITYGKDKTCTSTATIPQALHVNSESRKETKHYFKLSFASAIGPEAGVPKVWFAYNLSEHDTFYLGSGTILEPEDRGADGDAEMWRLFGIAVETHKEMLDTTADLDTLGHVGLHVNYLKVQELLWRHQVVLGLNPFKAFAKPIVCGILTYKDVKFINYFKDWKFVYIDAKRGVAHEDLLNICFNIGYENMEFVDMVETRQEEARIVAERQSANL